MLNSEKLWKCVLSHFSSNQKNPEKNIIWHIANNIEKSECVQCDELEGGPVIKCVVDRCKREYHVECAYQKGAFYLEENDPNAISFFCELHNKPPLFCVCQKPYDLSAEMVCCDECIEWFHIECIGVSKREVFKLEHYVCGSCTKLLSEGKSISTQEKERNVNKEKRSQLQQDANKRLRVLIEVSDVIAPMIDQLDGLTKSDHSLSVISDAYTYLSSDLFQCIPADDIDDADREMSKSGTAQELIPESMFGAEDLIRKWRLRLHQASGDFIDWKVSIKILLEKSTRDFAAHSLSSSQVSVIEPFLNAVEELRTEMSNLHLPVDVAPYATFFDIYSETWTHFHHFMRVRKQDNEIYDIK